MTEQASSRMTHYGQSGGLVILQVGSLVAYLVGDIEAVHESRSGA